MTEKKEETIEGTQSLFGRFNTANISQPASIFGQQNVIQQGFSKEVRSFLQAEQETNKGNYGFGCSHFPNQNQQKQSKVAIIRNTNIFKDTQSPWTKASEEVKNIFKSQDIQNSIHKFPQSIDNAFACHQQYINNRSGSQYHLNACGKFPISTYYFCYHCSRKQNSERLSDTFSYVICEDCFQPNLHIGHIYEKNNSYIGFGSSKLICICGKDAFLGHPPTYRCRLHCESREDKMIGQYSQQDMKNQSQLLKTIKSLFQIAFYLRKQMQSFQNLQKEEHDQYFPMIAKILNKMSNIIKKNGKLCIPFYNLLSQNKFVVYKQRNRSFFQSMFQRQTEGKQQHLLMYLLEQHQQKPTTQLILSLIQNDQVAKQFICKIGEQQYFSINQQITKELQMRINILLCRKTNRTLFYSDNNQKIIWLKSQSNFKYAVNFISSTIYSSSRNWSEREAYSNKMEIILSQFSQIPICNFMKKICIYLLPELLSWYRRIYSGKEFEQEDDEEQEQHDRQQTNSLEKLWEKNKINMVSLINRLILSLCDCKWQNLQNFQSIITKLHQQYNSQNILQQHHQSHNTPQQKQDKRTKQIKQNFKWYYNDICSSLNYAFGNIYYISDNNTNYHDQNRRMKEKIQQLLAVQKVLSQCYITYLVCTLLAGGGGDGGDQRSRQIRRLFKLGEGFFDARFGRGYRRDEGEDNWVEKASVYQLLAMLIFSKFHVPEIWVNELTNNKQAYCKQIKQLVQNHLGTIKNFKPLDLKILKLRLKIKQFKSLVQDNLVYDIPSKTFYYIETKTHPDQIYQLLNWKSSNSNSHLIGVKSLPELRKYLSQHIRRVLISLLIDTKFINKYKDQIKLMIQTIQKNVTMKNYYQTPKQKAYREISNNYLYYLSYLVILNEVCEGKNQFIAKELQQLNSSDSRYLHFMNKKQKSQTDLILFGKQRSEQLSKDNEKIQEKDVQIKMEESQRKSQVQQSIKERRLKQMKQKGNTILKQQAIQQAKEQVCITCHEGAQPENQLVYLMRCNMNKTVPSTFFKQVNKMNTNLRLCFHALHIKCYYNQAKKNCLLCGQFSNCIIPTKYNSKQKQLNRLCLNSLITAMYQAYKVYNVSNLFIILFKHLIQSKVFNSLINPQLYQQNKKKKHQSQLFLQQFLFDMYRQASPETKDQYDCNFMQLRNQCMKVENKILGKLQIMFVNALFHKIRDQKIIFQLDQLEKLVVKIKKQDFMVVFNQICEIQPNLESAHLQKIYCQNTDNKQQISKQYPLSLPKYAHQLSSFGTEGCFFCHQPKRQGICLICGCTLCRMCSSSSQHSRQHEEKALDFLFEQAKLKFNMSMSKEQSQIFWSTGNQKQIPVYYNHLMIPFRQALIFKPLEEDESIELNEKLFYGLAEMLLN